MPRFVLLDHDHPTPHLDLMLEAGPALWTWRLAVVPESGHEQQATRIPDHRLTYLDFEGPVSDGRGRVTRRDAGDFTLLEQSDDRLVLAIRGRVLCGRLALTRKSDAVWAMAYERAV